MRKAIAIDFDGCLCSDDYPRIGKPNWKVIERAKQEQAQGAGLILWSCRAGELLLEALIAANSWGLCFDAVNESLPDWIEEFGTCPRKVGATEYWDDRAVRMPGDSGGQAAETPFLDTGGTDMEAADGEEKRAIVQRLKDYRAASGLGLLEAVSVKTAHFRGQRISTDTLRDICADGAPIMEMSEWRKISRALDLMTSKEAADGDSN